VHTWPWHRRDAARLGRVLVHVAVSTLWRYPVQFRRTLLASAAVAALAMGGIQGGSAQSAATAGADLGLYVGTGDCSKLAKMDALTSIGTVTVLEPKNVGLEAADDAAIGSGSIAGFRVDELPTVEGHVELVAADGERLACGEIGGAFMANGDLLVGLREDGDSNVTGVAYFAPARNGVDTDVTVFVAGEDLFLIASEAEVTAATSGAEATYLAAADRLRAELDASVTKFDTLIANAQVGDPVWTKAVAAEFATWDRLEAEASALVPPAGYEDAHMALVDGLGAYIDGADALAQGIDTGDNAAITEAAKLLREAEDLVNEAEDLFAEARAS